MNPISQITFEVGILREIIQNLIKNNNKIPEFYYENIINQEIFQSIQSQLLASLDSELNVDFIIKVVSFLFTLKVECFGICDSFSLLCLFLTYSEDLNLSKFAKLYEIASSRSEFDIILNRFEIALNFGLLSFIEYRYFLITEEGKCDFVANKSVPLVNLKRLFDSNSNNIEDTFCQFINRLAINTLYHQPDYESLPTFKNLPLNLKEDLLSTTNHDLAEELIQKVYLPDYQFFLESKRFINFATYTLLPFSTFDQTDFETYLEDSLRYCAEYNDVSLLISINNLGLDIHKILNYGWSSLLYSALYGNFEVLELLIQLGGSVNQTDDNDWTPLICTAFNGHISCVQLLLDNGATIDIHDDNDKTALMQASKIGLNSEILTLIEHGSNIYAFDNKKRTVLHYASKFGHSETLNLLLQYCDNIIDFKNTAGNSALMMAAIRGHVSCIKVCLEHGANINLKNYAGFTALMLAAKNKHHECLQFLIDKGADVKLVSLRNNSALSICEENQDQDGIKILEKALLKY